MDFIHKIFVVVFILLGFAVNMLAENQDSIIDKKVETLLSQMTLEEKVGQMANLGFPAVCKNQGYWNAGDTLILDTAKLRFLIGKYHIGSIQNKGAYPPTKEEWYRLCKQVQDWNLKNSRLHIPLLLGIDGVHGANYTAASTLFPQQIACAATWDPQFAYKTGEITSYELRASNLTWNYAPVLDVCRQPLWGRIYETYGEDTYLATIMGTAFIKGAQGDDISSPYKTGICLKHFIGYASPYSGKDRTNTAISDWALRQYFLPPFQAAIKEGALNVMINSGAVNNIPCHANGKLINGLLKKENNFKGFTISDWGDLDNLVYTDNVAENAKEAIAMAINAGVDMGMAPYDESFAVTLTELVKEGKVSIERIDDAVRRILRFKYKLGLFDRPNVSPSDYPKFGSEDFANESYKAALECLTMLKNDSNILPLARGKKILVTGVAGNSMNYLNGGWSRDWSGQIEAFADKNKLTIFQALQEKFGKENVFFKQGTGYTEDINSKEAIESAKNVDYIVVCLGELPATEKPSDIDELDMPEVQQNLVKELSKLNKPIILVLVEGRPRIIRNIEPLAKSIIHAFLPGNEGGRALATVLVGEFSPCGKLPYTYPRYCGDIVPYNHKRRDDIGTNFGDGAFKPQFQFGFGLSYASFEYSNMKISTDSLLGNKQLTISVDVRNTGKMAAKEVIECYIQDLVASIQPDVRKLVRFTKVELKQGETRNITFTIDRNDLAFVNTDSQWVTEPGRFKVYIGGNPSKLMEKTFYWNK